MTVDLNITDYQVTFDASMRSQSRPIPIKKKTKRSIHSHEDTSTKLTIPCLFYNLNLKSFFPNFLTSQSNKSPSKHSIFHFLALKDIACLARLNKMWKKFSEQEELALDASKRLYKRLRSTPFTQIKEDSVELQDWQDRFKTTYYLRFITSKSKTKFEFSVYTYPIYSPDVIFQDVLEIKNVRHRIFFRKIQMELIVINKALTKNQLTFTRNVVKIINDERENIGRKEAEAFPYFARI